jgi:hypothetical protein
MARKRVKEETGPVIIRNRITIDRLLDYLEKEFEACETKVFSGKDGLLYSEDMIAWNIRQKARMDAHKLRGDYPAEKSEVDLKLPNAMALVVQSRQEAKRKPKKKNA